MSLKQSLIVACALTLIGAAGCKKKSNTTEQQQSNTSGSAGAAGSGAPMAGSDTNPHAPNPAGATPGEPMGSAAMGVGAGNNPMLDGGIDGGAAGAGAGAGAAGGAAGAGGGSAK